MKNAFRSRRRFDRGFSLVELLVSLVIIVVISVAALAMFDRSNRMAKVENSVADAQQNARYASYQTVREARMAGAGGVPASTGSVQQGVTLSLGTSTYHSATNGRHLLNNINVATDVICIGGACGTSGAHHIRKGTDALHIRGVISNAIYDLGTSSFDTSTGTLVIHACTKFTDPTAAVTAPCYPNGQNDVSFFNSWSDSQPRMFVMSDALGNVGVSLITHAVVGSDGASKPNATLTLGTTNAYVNSINSSGAFPSGLTTPTRGGVLDDLLYFVDDGTDLGQSCGTSNQSTLPGPCHPQLAVAQWGVGGSGGCTTTVETPMACATVTPIADDIEDLQIAYGVDFRSMGCTNSGSALTCTGSGTFASPVSDGSLSITDATTFATIVKGAYTTTAPNVDPSEDTSTADNDEWIGNVSGEITTTGSFGYTSDLSLLKSVEIAILAKGTQPDPPYVGLGAKSWSVMDTGAQTVSAQNLLAYHRRLISVRADLRNFGTF